MTVDFKHDANIIRSSFIVGIEEKADISESNNQYNLDRIQSSILLLAGAVYQIYIDIGSEVYYT
jgi:hypothetical protein